MTNLQSYEQYLINKAKSKDTIATYITRVNLFLKFANNELTRENILLYKKELQSKSLKAVTINLSLSAIRSYLNFIDPTNSNSNNIIIKDDYITIQKEEYAPNTFGEVKMNKLIDKIKQNENLRNQAIILLMYSAGTRISETLNIKLTDINFKKGEILIRNGKGEKERLVYISEDISKVLNNYIDTFRNKYKVSSTSPYLFVSQMGSKLVSASVNHILSKYNINPHQFRHEIATRMIQSGTLNIIELKGFLGHSRIETTMKYTHPDKQSMKDKINKLKVI